MEILVFILLALFIAIIIIAITLFVMLRKRSIDKAFSQKDDDFSDIDDDNEDELPNVVLPINFARNLPLNSENMNEKKADVEIIDDINEFEVNNLPVEKLEEERDVDSFKFNDADNNSQNIINNINNGSKSIKKERIEEVVNVLINKKNYIFLANNYQVKRNEHIKLVIDNKIYFGTITKANYYRDLNTMKIKPKKLIMVKNKSKKDVMENKFLDEELEFIPKKKKKD